jgi:spermidine synthase
MEQNQFFTELFYRKTVGQSYKIKTKLYEEQSPWQKIEVYDTECIGKLLTLDGKTMVSEADEFVYHECMAHIPSMISRRANNVLVVGGGDGGVVREFVKHKDIKRIDLVEIDERVIEVSKIYFPQCTSGLSDPRVNIHCKDGVEFIKNHPNTYDIIIIDSTDPEDFAAGLFTQEFYTHVAASLTHEGIMMAQTENPFLDEFSIGNFYDNLRAVFPIVQSFAAPMLIYPGVYWSFAFASKKYQGIDLNIHKNEEMKEIEKTCQWYNREWHLGAFRLSNYHKKAIRQQ